MIFKMFYPLYNSFPQTQRKWEVRYHKITDQGAQ